MGLLVIALLALSIIMARRVWGRVSGNPLPTVTARQRRGGRVRHFLDSLGKARRRLPVATGSCDHPAVSPLVADGTDCEVLVVGAGPSGLMTAALLVRQGVQVRIIDAGSGPATESRAFAIQARTIELFRGLGLADELLSRGVVTTGIEFHIKGRHVGGLDFDRARAGDTPYQFILMAPQAEVEELLLKDLARHGLTVERDTRLVSLEQTEDQVTAVLDGSTISCRYVVGADGSRSTVRSSLGLAFEGDQYAQQYLLADCKVDWPLDHSRFRVFMNGERIGLFLPLDGSKVSRVMATDSADEPASLERLQAALREAMKIPVTLSQPVWVTRYKVHLRKVEQYRVGRGFLVGDAAHIHSPAGGQGLNTGLHDAANLAWKLAAVLRTGAAPTLLDSYSDERQPVGVQLLRFTDRLYKVAADLHGVRAKLRDFFGPFLVGRMSAAPIPHRKSFRRLSQLGLSYPASDYNINELLYSLAGPRAGQRAPDAQLGAGRQMFDLLTGYRLQVVAFSRRNLDEAEIAAHTAQLRSIEALGGTIATQLIGRVAARRDDRVQSVESVEVFERYGLTQPDSEALYVIRPDGHVAWRMDELDYDACRRYLSRLYSGATCEVCQG
ncbi:FAD-dependent monooxygenase [Kribbella sp. NPDC056861]|uniref:FAD-dependent monooxygenase n=1 Tax=Kribbella sp. NPDC056861 TaxID=3154857 RepID=UPI00341AF41A